MEGTKSELKILLSNMKSKKEEMEHDKLADYIHKSHDQVIYMAGELILYERNMSLGLVLQVHPDFLRVLTPNNEIVSVKHQIISKKLLIK